MNRTIGMTPLDHLISRVRQGPRPIVILSHRRSGTHLSIDLIRKQFPGTSPRLRPFAQHTTLYLSLDKLRPGHHAPITPDQAVAMLDRAPHLVIKTHARPDAAGRLPEFGVNEPLARAMIDHAFKINIVRDGRDVLCSQQLYEKSYNPDARLPAGQFLRTTFEGEPRPAYWARHAVAWKDTPGVLTVTFEAIIRSTDATLDRFAEHLSIAPRRVAPLLPVQQSTSRLGRALNRALGRGETTAIEARPRKGVGPVKWREAWTADDRAHFDRHAGDTLIELGYEPDHSWATQP